MPKARYDAIRRQLGTFGAADKYFPRCSSRQMGSDYILRSRRSSRPLSCTLYAVVVPVVVVLLVFGLLRNHAQLPSSVRQLSSGFADSSEAYSSYSIDTQQSPCPPCTQAATALGDTQHIPLNLSQYPADLSGNSSDAAAQPLRAKTKGSLPSLFLFTGVLSGRGYRHRRLAVRESWSNKAQVPGVSVSRFILSEDERTPQVTKEVDQHGDIVFVDHKTNYKSILFKTYYVLEYAVSNYDVKFVLKTDDDAFINVAPLINQLHLLCITEDCTNERIYMGRMAKESEVLLQPGHKWNNIVFHNHTGLRTYPTYAMGGGYVLSGDVAKMLVTIHLNMKLKFTPIEDATVGFWLMSMDLRHIDHRRFHTWAAPCCFKPPQRREGQRAATRFLLQEDIEGDLCSEDPWLVLHKIDSPTKMRFVGNRVSQCDPANFTTTKVAASLAHYIGPEGALDAEAVEKEMQQAALAAVAAAAQLSEAAQGGATRSGAASAVSGLPMLRKHKLPSDFPAAAAAAAAAGQHLDGEAVDEVSVHDDKSAAQKLSEQIIEQRKLGDGDADVDAGAVVQRQSADTVVKQEPADTVVEQKPAGMNVAQQPAELAVQQQLAAAGEAHHVTHEGQADALTALQQASQLAGQAQTADLTALQQEQQAQQLQVQQQQQQAEQQAAAAATAQQQQQQAQQQESQAAAALTAQQQAQQQQDKQAAVDLTALHQQQPVAADLAAQQQEQQKKELPDAIAQETLQQQQLASQAQQTQTMQS